MKLKRHSIVIASLFLLLLTSCLGSDAEKKVHDNKAIGKRFADAFYSFQKDSLQQLLVHAAGSQPEILYYQQWAKCANYKALDRSHYSEVNDSMVLMPVTVEDDLVKALASEFHVTDTFHLKIIGGEIISVTTSSNDLPDYYAAKEWVRANRPSYIDKACEGIWAGGPTPCDCVLGMIRGFKEFIQQKQN